MKREREPAIIRCLLLEETNRAVLLSQGDRTVWLPRSQCDHITRLHRDDTSGHFLVEVEMPDWVAEEKGLSGPELSPFFAKQGG